MHPDEWELSAPLNYFLNGMSAKVYPEKWNCYECYEIKDWFQKLDITQWWGERRGESVSRSVMSILCDPMVCSTPGSSLHGILQARIVEWVAIPFSRGSFWPRDQTWVSWIAGRFFIVWANGTVRGRWTGKVTVWKLRGLSMKLLASLPEALVRVDKLELSGEYKRPVISSH